jgi:SRSO17 transposase
MMDNACADELPPVPILADAGYGNVTAFRNALSERLIRSVVGIGGETTASPPYGRGDANRHRDSSLVPFDNRRRFWSW